MPFPAALRALNHRDFRLFWTGQSISSVGSWMQSVGLSWLVLELTNSPFRLGVVSALQFAPVLLFSAVAGVVVDRTPKRRLILGTQIALMLPAFALAGLAWTGWVRYWHVATLAGVIGLVNALDMPSRQSFLVEMVGREDLLNGIALNSATFNSARVIGPALGGLLIARYGTAVAFLLNALSFLAVVMTLTAVRVGSEAKPRRGTTIREELRDGVRYATRTPLVALILGLVFAVSTFAMNHGVLVPLFAREVLHEGVHVFGLLMASLGAGAVIGAVALATLGGGRPPLAAVVVPGMGVALGIHQSRVRAALRPGGGRPVPRRDHADRLPERLQHDRSGHGAGRAPRAGHGRLHDGLRRCDAPRSLAHRLDRRGGRGARRLPGRRGARSPRRPAPARPLAPREARLRMSHDGGVVGSAPHTGEGSRQAGDRGQDHRGGERRPGPTTIAVGAQALSTE